MTQNHIEEQQENELQAQICVVSRTSGAVRPVVSSAERARASVIAIAVIELLEDLPAPAYAPLSQTYRYLGNEDWHGRMCRVEEWERIRFAALQKLIVSTERAAEIQRRQPYNDVGRPLVISTGKASGWTASKIRIPRKLREQSENALAKYGLSLQQQKLQEAPQGVIVPVFETTPKCGGTTVEGFEGYAFAKYLSLLSDSSGIFSMLDGSDFRLW